jgi:hypothetical protein
VKIVRLVNTKIQPHNLHAKIALPVDIKMKTGLRIVSIALLGKQKARRSE